MLRDASAPLPFDRVGGKVGVAGAGSDLCMAKEFRHWLASSCAPGRGGVSLLPMLGIFGRSHELQRLDQALRGVGLHPRVVPEAVKLTIFKLLKEPGSGAGRRRSNRNRLLPAAI